jgi:hypothetical protein
MNPSVSATPRNAFSLHESPASTRLPSTPTARLLEVACGLSREEIEAMLSASQPKHTAFPDRPSALNGYQTFGVITCAFLLSAIVAALIISLA